MAAMDVTAFLDSGKKFYEQDNYDSAIEEFIKAIKLEPNHEEAKIYLASSYFNRGIRHFRSGEQEKAIADLTESIRFNPNDATAYGARGSLMEMKKDYDGVIKDFTEVIRLEPTALAYCSRANGYYYKGRKYLESDEKKCFEYFELSIKEWEEAVKLDPSNELFKKQLNSCVSELEKRKSVSAYLKK